MAYDPSGRSQRVPDQPSTWVKWSGVGFQMLAAIIICTFAGIWLDNKVQWGFPVFTVCLSILGVVAGLVQVYRGVMKG
jgi:ATP synthase protein I